MNAQPDAESLAQSPQHKMLMDGMYKMQRHIYDATRRYYLLGRDELLRELQPPEGGHVLEIGCGTGRNIVKAAQLYPSVIFYGVDISDEMLKSATSAVHKAKLHDRVKLASGDATNFDARRSFGRSQFDRVYFSFTLSMIPSWQDAVENALSLLPPQGQLHIVDFGQCEGLPDMARASLFRWLKLFHVTPCKDIAKKIRTLAGLQERNFHFEPSYGGYAWNMQVGRKL